MKTSHNYNDVEIQQKFFRYIFLDNADARAAGVTP
jgi:hypothetical protein